MAKLVLSRLFRAPSRKAIFILLGYVSPLASDIIRSNFGRNIANT